MIKPQELRIGNLISRKDFGNGEVRFETILELGSKAIVSGPIKVSVDYEDISPIPLTEEWLLKFGFEYNSPDWQPQILSLDVMKVESPFVDFTWINNAFGARGSEFHYDMPHIKYVHQLQNLYFALTGEELTIKE